MSRVHLFEFEDLNWFPGFLRNYMTDFLQFLSNKTSMYKPIIQVLSSWLKKNNTSQIIDLGSGGGGGLIKLNSELEKHVGDLHITLTDYYPNLPAFKKTCSLSKSFSFHAESVDASAVPNHLIGARTMFLSFHHFNKHLAQSILQNAIDAGQPIAIIEAQERSVPSLLAMLFSPLTVLFVTPFIRPFSFGRLFFTYLIPILPMLIMWDGIVSSLRTYSVKELKTMVASLRGAYRFTWEINRVTNGPGAVIYLLGSPIHSQNATA